MKCSVSSAMSQAAGREVSRNAHQQRDAQHEPQEFPVGREYFAQRNGVGDGRADDDPVALHGRIEIVLVGAFRVAVDGVTGAMGDRFGDFGAPEVVGCGQRVLNKKIGDHVDIGEKLLTVYARDDLSLELIDEIYQSYTIVDEFVEKPILIEEFMK